MASLPDDVLTITRRLVASTPFDTMSTQLRQRASTDSAHAPVFLALGAWASVIADDLEAASNDIAAARHGDLSQLAPDLALGIQCLAMFIDAYRGTAGIDHALLTRMVGVIAAPSDPTRDQLGRFAWLTEVANWFTFADRYEDAANVLDRRIGLGDEEDAGEPAELISALCCRAELDLRRGRWRRAERDLAMAIEVSESNGHSTGYARTLAARVAAGRGDYETCDRHLRCALPEAIDRGDHSTRWRAEAARAFASVTRGDDETARSLLAPLADDAEANSIRMASVRMWDSDYLAALVRLDERDDAIRHVKWIANQSELVPSRWARGLIARGSAELEENVDVALELAEHSVTTFDSGGAVFEAARSRLTLARVLERCGRLDDAERVRQMAARTFDAIGAAPWSERADPNRAALTPSISVRAEAAAPRLALLTPQEREIARCIAAGESNKEIAAELFISVKTVEAHLTRIYRKLDLRSRGELIAGYLGNTLDDDDSLSGVTSN